MTTLTPTPTETRFRQLVHRWKDESRFLSNTAQMAMLRSYQSIIGMGRPAVPLLLAELRREPDHWFWALEAITSENPVSPQDAGHLDRMSHAWIEWGLREGVIT